MTPSLFKKRPSLLALRARGHPALPYMRPPPLPPLLPPQLFARPPPLTARPDLQERPPRLYAKPPPEPLPLEQAFTMARPAPPPQKVPLLLVRTP